MAIVFGICVTVGGFLYYNWKEHQANVNAIYDDMAEDMDRIERDLRSQGRTDTANLFREIGQERVAEMPKLKAAVDRLQK